MTNYSNIGQYGNIGSYGAGYASGPSASVMARVESAMAMHSGNVAKLNASVLRDQTKLSGLGQLQSALTGFQSIAERLAGNGLSTTVTSSTKGVLGATVGSAGKPGSYAVDVKQLAQGQVLNSDKVKSADGKIGTGSKATVTIEFGTVDGKDFKAGKGDSKSIVIDSSNNTLEGIAAALKKAGMDATVVKDGDGYSLSLKGTNGEANSMRISVTGDAAVKDLLSYNPATAGGMTQSAAAQDSVVVVDGKEVRGTSNKVEDAASGVTLQLTGTGKTDVVVAQDASQIGKNVGNFVTAFNDLQNTLAALQKGALKSDQALSQVSREMATLVRTASPTALAAAGITVDNSGKLQLDEKKLQSAIAADPAAVAKLFTDDGKGLADRFDSKIDALTGKNSTIQKEALAANKDLDSLATKKAEMSKAMTAQAQALAQMYTQQEQAASGGGAFGGGKPMSLFDFMV